MPRGVQPDGISGRPFPTPWRGKRRLDTPRGC